MLDARHFHYGGVTWTVLFGTMRASLLKFDENIDIVTYESILCKMSVVHSDDDVLVLAAKRSLFT